MFNAKQYNKDWQARNRERVRAYANKYDQTKRKEDPNHYVKKIFRERKRICKEQGIPFEIVLEDVLPVPTECPILGIPLSSGQGRNNQSSASLDRIIPFLGYVKGNVHWISWRANRIKSDATAAELRQIADYIESLG